MFENAVYEHIPATLDEVARRGRACMSLRRSRACLPSEILEHFGLADRFVAIFGSELDGRLCDKSELIEHVLQVAALDPTESVMIGDREHDMFGAVRNHVYPAGVLWGYGSHDELRNAGAKRLLTAPAEIPQLFERAAYMPGR